MTITQTVEIPADRRITVPREVPTGVTVLVFKPNAETTDRLKNQEAIENCSGLAKRMGINLSSDDFLEMRRQDKKLEEKLASTV